MRVQNATMTTDGDGYVSQTFWLSDMRGKKARHCACVSGDVLGYVAVCDSRIFRMHTPTHALRQEREHYFESLSFENYEVHGRAHVCTNDVLI